MSAKAREFIDFWIEVSVHAAEQSGAGGEQIATELARRCLDMAASQGISRADLEKEVGQDLTVFVQEKLATANKIENERPDQD